MVPIRQSGIQGAIRVGIRLWRKKNNEIMLRKTAAQCTTSHSNKYLDKFWCHDTQNQVSVLCYKYRMVANSLCLKPCLNDFQASLLHVYANIYLRTESFFNQTKFYNACAYLHIDSIHSILHVTVALTLFYGVRRSNSMLIRYS